MLFIFMGASEMNKIQGEMRWKYREKLNEALDFQDESTVGEIAENINSKKLKIESSMPGITTYLVRQTATVADGRLIVLCE
jgi:hypothetical protein